MNKLIHFIRFTISYDLSLMKKLMISFVSFIILPLVLLAFFSYKNTAGNLVKQFEHSSMKALTQTATYLDKIIGDLTNSSVQASFNQAVTTLASAGSNSSTLDYNSFLTANNIIRSYFRNDNIYSIELYIDRDDIFTLPSSNGQRNIHYIFSNNTFAKAIEQKLSNYTGSLLWLPPRQIEESITGNKYSVLTGARYIRHAGTYSVQGLFTINIEQD